MPLQISGGKGQINTSVGVVELLHERAYTFSSADNARKYRFEHNFADVRQPFSIHGILLNGEPLAVFGAGGGPSGVHERSMVYVEGLLFLAVGNRVVCVQLEPFLFKWALETDAATCFGVYFAERVGALISHGELEIVRFSPEGNILWGAAGADIFIGAFSLRPDFIEAVDWNGRVYCLNYDDGKELLFFGEWIFANDSRATQETYSNIRTGGADECACNACRNFVIVRDRVFPPAFLSLLRSLGIDPHKDGEVYHNGQHSPGRHDYGGWYHFVGSLNRSGDFSPVSFGDGFTAWLCERNSPALPGLNGLPLIELNFHTDNVPWCLPG